MESPMSLTLALRALLLAVDGLLDAACGLRIFPPYLAECGASGFLLLQSGKRLTKPQQGIRGFRRLVGFARHGQKSFRRLTILLALEEAFSEPELRFCRHRIVRVFPGEIAHGFFGERIVLALDVTDAEIVFVAWRGRRRQGS